MKKIAIIGSSGGNLYNLGGSFPEKLLAEISVQCDAAGFEVAAVQFIAAEASMDGVKLTTPASLYSLSDGRGTKPHRTVAQCSGHLGYEYWFSGYNAIMCIIYLYID